MKELFMINLIKVIYLRMEFRQTKLQYVMGNFLANPPNFWPKLLVGVW